jgi:predicted Zn-dependent peptidase
LLRIKKLTNGTTIATDHRPYALDFSLCVAFGNGSSHERLEHRGLAHFFEHANFRGTHRYPTSFKLSRPFDRLGTCANAGTEREVTDFNGTVPARHWRTSVDLMTDLIFNALYREEELAIEKRVVLSELDEAEGNPNDLLRNMSMKLLYGDCPLSREIIGTRKTVRSFDAALLMKFREQSCTPDNTVVVAVGRLPSGLGRVLTRIFGERPARPRVHYSEAPRPTGPCHGHVYFPAIEQVHFCLSFLNGYGHGHPLIAATDVLAAAMGGYITATLSQEIRDKRGLAYNVGADISNYAGTGHLDFVCELAPRHLDQALGLMVEELAKVKRQGLSRVDLADAKSALAYNVMLSSQDSSSEAERLAYCLTVSQKDARREAVARRYRAVTNEDIMKVAGEVLTASNARLATVGPYRRGASRLAIVDRLGG